MKGLLGLRMLLGRGLGAGLDTGWGRGRSPNVVAELHVADGEHAQRHVAWRRHQAAQKAQALRHHLTICARSHSSGFVSKAAGS